MIQHVRFTADVVPDHINIVNWIPTPAISGHFGLKLYIYRNGLVMSKHPVNLFIRFLLELVALSVFAVWGYHLSDSWSRFLLAIIACLFFAGLWGIFAVPGDPSRSGKTVIPTPGKVRLVLELLLFSAATGMISGLTKPWMAWLYGGIVLLHYVTSYDRISWLLNRR